MIVDDMMIVETCSHLTDYHQLSFALNMFKIVMVVDDRFSRLTVCMIVDDS